VNEDNDKVTVSSSNVEQTSINEPLAKDVITQMDSPFHIRVISVRRINHDPDGVSVKAVLDGIVHAGLCSDDSAKQVKQISFESRKTRKGEEEETIILLDTEEIPYGIQIEGVSNVFFYETT